MSTATMPLHPVLAAVLERQRAAGVRPIRDLTPGELRAQMASARGALPPGPELFDVRDTSIEGPSAPVAVRRYRPSASEPLGTVVYFHSGGFVAGSVDGSDALVRRLAQATGCEYLNVEYRLAPEHRFPAALDDAVATIAWAATLGRPLAVQGDSAGGNLATVAAWLLRSRVRIALQVLSYPVTDHDFARRSYVEHADDGLLRTADLVWFWDHYLPDVVGRDDPRASPLRAAELVGMPPTLINVAEYDPLRDEGLAYAKRLAEAGVSTTVNLYGDLCHGFLPFAGALDRADQCVETISSLIQAEFNQATG